MNAASAAADYALSATAGHALATGAAGHAFAPGAVSQVPVAAEAAQSLLATGAAHSLMATAAGHAPVAGAAHSLLDVVVLGIVEGVTEFLPVSSTGHLILATKLLGFDPEGWALFNIVIQLGAILAIVVLYWRTLLAVARGLVRRDPVSLRFVRNLLLAFAPAVVIGLAVHRQVEALLGHAEVVAVALIVGGLAILLIERTSRRVTVNGVADMPVRTALAIGLVQCLAMIPGVSRSGATIMGALAFGVERRTAAEFSFFLAIPTMLGATTLELVKNRALLDAAELHDIAIGFVVAFVVALVVVRAFVRAISRYGFAPFAWYRIAVGSVALVWLHAL